MLATQPFKNKYRDNPNPNAKIGFVIYYPFQFYVYKNVYRHLKENSEFIIDLGVFFPKEQPNDLLDNIVSLLKKHNAHFRILYNDDYSYVKYLESFFSKYQLLASLWEQGCMKIKCNLDKKKVNLNYGAGKELTMVRPSRGLYDLILAYGPRDGKLFSYYTQCQIVGNPKFDDWFNGEFDRELLADLKNKVHANKKTILYLPTHSDLGSIKDLAEPLKKMARSYNVIVKLHYFNITDEPELVEKLRNENVILFKDDVDMLPLLKVADVVLSDSSSAIFDAILADKPLVVTDFFSKEFLDITHKKIKLYRRGKFGALTYSGSIEQKIKKDGLLVIIQTPQQLKEGIERGLEDGPFYKNARKKIREEVFAFNDGKCGKRAAKAIMELLNNKELLERPILYHAIEVFENQLRRRSRSEQKKDARLISEYENLLFKKKEREDRQGVIFSVIVIHDQTKTEFLKNEFLESTLRSLLGQTLPQQNYEIIIANGPPEEEVKEIIKEIPQIIGWVPAIKYVAPGDSNPGLGFINDAINKAAGEIICFTESGYVVPSDWLLNFYLAYQKHPDVAGVGGYTTKYTLSYTIYDEYYYLELRRRMGLAKEGWYLRKLYELENNLFHQNPAGTLANMSYKKDVLSSLAIQYEKIHLIELVEMLFKQKTLQSNTLCFIPMAVTDLTELTATNFREKNFREGVAAYLFCLMNQAMKRHGRYSFASVLKLPLLNILDGYWKVRLSFVIFLGTFYRWLGFTYARLMIKLRENEPRDAPDKSPSKGV